MMFDLLRKLMEIQKMRVIHWNFSADERYLVVHIPVSDEDVLFTKQMQELMEPTYTKQGAGS